MWEKGKIPKYNDVTVWRKDECGAWIKRSKYGDIKSPYGWYIGDLSLKGDDETSNLRPLNWKNKLDETSRQIKCRVTAKGIKNVEK
jgi:hypothetical protein